MTAAEALREAAQMCRERAEQHVANSKRDGLAHLHWSSLEAMTVARLLYVMASVREAAAEKAKGDK